MPTFRPAHHSRGRALSIYLPAHTLKLVQPWAASHTRSARVATIIERYDGLISHRPALDLAEWGIAVQLIGPHASLHRVGTLWAEILDRSREGPLPGIEAPILAAKLRRLVPAELVAMLEVADRVAVGSGSLRERLAAAGLGEGP